MTLILLNEAQGLVLRDDVNTANTIFMRYPIHLVCNFHQLRPKGRCDELSGSRISLPLYHVCTRGEGELLEVRQSMNHIKKRCLLKLQTIQMQVQDLVQKNIAE